MAIKLVDDIKNILMKLFHKYNDIALIDDIMLDFVLTLSIITIFYARSCVLVVCELFVQVLLLEQ